MSAGCVASSRRSRGTDGDERSSAGGSDFSAAELSESSDSRNIESSVSTSFQIWSASWCVASRSASGIAGSGVRFGLMR